MASAEIILIFGAIGSAGNKYITGVFLWGTLLAVLLLGFRGLPKWNFGDVLFATILVGITASFVFNPWATDIREFLLLLISLFAYVACRSISVEQLPTIRAAIKLTAGCVVFLGTVFTGWALVQQWNNPHGHPFVFGFDAGATNFSYCLGFMILAFISDHLTRKQTLILCALLVLPAAVFGASLVRFVFLAIFGTLLIDIFLNRDRQQRAYVAAVAGTVLIAAGLGFAVRDQTSMIHFRNVTQIQDEQPNRTLKKPLPTRSKAFSFPIQLPFVSSVSPDRVAPSCALQINKNDSVAIRKALLGDALYFAPAAGPLGFGLDSFFQYSCVGSFEVHNSLLQAIVEFGWIVGGALIALIGYAGFLNLQLARRDPNVRFFLCSLAYLAALSLIYGRASREMALFAIIGVSIGIIETAKKQTKHPLRANAQKT
jgi:MFS family permease